MFYENLEYDCSYAVCTLSGGLSFCSYYSAVFVLMDSFTVWKAAQ